MAKAAIENMTRYIAKHGGKYNIRMNAIAPGFIVQDEHLERFYSDDNVAFRTIANEIHPLKSIGNSDDIANMVLFLSSEKSKFINGQTIIIDGGLTIQDSWDLVYKSGFE
jgi:NAD(P)-dependent dehydrogenase (short-subunit alcohol dehydrogenase family)